MTGHTGHNVVQVCQHQLSFVTCDVGKLEFTNEAVGG